MSVPSRPVVSSRARRGPLTVAAVVGAAALVLPPVASAEWSEVGPFPNQLGDAVQLGGVTFGPDGTLTTYGGSLPPGNRSVPPAYVGERRPGGSWPGRNGLQYLSPTTYGSPAISYGEDGSAAAIVGSYDGGRVTNWNVSVRGGDGTWGPLTHAGPTDSGLQLNARLVIDRQNRLVVVWVGQYDSAGVSPVLTSTRPLEGGSWTAPKQIGTADTGPYIDSQTRIYGGTSQYSGMLSRPEVAEDGSISIAWTTGSVVRGTAPAIQVDPTGLQVSRRSPGGTWSAPVGIVTPEAASGGRVQRQITAVDNRGGVVAAMTGIDTANQTTTRTWYLRAGATTWSAPNVLDDPVDGLAAVGDGQALAVSLVNDQPADASYRYLARAQTTVDAGGRWSPARTVSPVGVHVSGLSVAANRTPGMITLGLDTDPDSPDVPAVGTVRDWYPWTDTFTRQYDVPDAQSASVAGTDRAGDTAIAIYKRGADKRTVTVDDVSGPDIDELTAPAVLKPKKRGAFAVKATDAFSKLGTTTWDFGDGASANGPSVQHAFKKAGTYTVSVTTRDEWGYPTATSTTVSVARSTSTAAATRVRKAGAPKRLVRVQRLQLGAGRLSLRTTGAGKLLVSVQRRTAQGAPAGPARTVRLQPRAAGRIVARVRGIRRGTYAVRVTADPRSRAKVARRSAILHLGRR